MEVKPVILRKKPDYPSLEFYINNPQMLSRNVPDRWMKNKYVASSVAAFIICGYPNNSMKVFPESMVLVDEVNKDNSFEVKKDVQDSIKIAPIFVHGDGSGAIGCEVMSPPVFISEEDAMKIIFNAFKSENIIFDTNNCPSIKFKAQPIANDCSSFYDSIKSPLANVEIKMDGYNADYNLAIQYVSENDFMKFQSDDGCWSTVQGYNTKEAAELIREELIKNSKTNVAIFYDPVQIDDFFDNSGDKNQKDPALEANELLLAQVRDFIIWLKNEKLLKK